MGAALLQLGVHRNRIHPGRLPPRSARVINEYERMSAMFAELYPDVAVPKAAWTWIESGRHRMLRHQRPPSAVDRRTAPSRPAGTRHPRCPADRLSPTGGRLASGPALLYRDGFGFVWPRSSPVSAQV